MTTPSGSPDWVNETGGTWETSTTSNVNPIMTDVAERPVIPGAASVNFTDAQQSAFGILSAMLTQYGLGSLSNTLRDIILSGITNQDEISLQLQQTPEWKTRFSGNEALRAKGLPVLSVAEYLGVESSYSQILKNFGLPQGFYDDPSDFAGWIGNSVSASEIQQRAQMYSDVARRQDPAITAQLQAMGMSDGDILAHMMDPSRALPLLQQKYQTALIGGAARRAGLTPDSAYAQHLADIGITEQQAIQGYGQIAGELPVAQKLGDIWHEAISQTDLESEAFENNGAVTSKKRRLASRERAAFSGTAGVGQGSLSRGTSGSF